ncbi:MAG: hypothetical protein DLM65_08085 [Candidatus Aeolococcus gillhamiae]|uniref:Site-specific integrase n=1 Tax=Candidatus Aeolococcus gillhamiae TaxID=3127015 RepID=A0A2W5ZC15_9BACT|nr:MAG: hypothetical protein DLM65_08085 [Candidatus Dormibacter sp. RRmetagenome_bin12]
MARRTASPGRRTRANGEGTVSRRQDGRWEARVFVRQDGRWVRRALYAKTKAEASRKLREAITARDKGLPMPKGSTTVAAFLEEEWWPGVAPSLRPGSQRRYHQVVTDYLVPALGRRRLVDLQPEHLQTLYGRLLAEGKSPATVRLAHAVLHRALSRALSWGKVVRNVADASMVDLPRSPRREAAHFDAQAARLVVGAAQGDRLEALWALALTAGLRRGELLALRWDAVDLDRGVVEVRYTLQPDGSLAEPKSASSRRAVPIADAVISVLRSHMSSQAAERLEAGNQWQEPRLSVAGSKVTLDGGLVFTTPLGRPLPITSMVKAWVAVLGRAGVPIIPFHGTRHTAASLLADAGVHPTVAQARLGHATSAMTLERYTHVGEAQRRGAADDVERLLGLSS